MPLWVVGGNAENPAVMMDAFGNGLGLILRRANGTAASPSMVNNGDALGAIAWRGYGAAAYGGVVGQIRASALENWSDAAQGTNIVFSTTPAGTVALTTQATMGPGLTVGAPGLPAGGMLTGDLAALRLLGNRNTLAPPPVPATNFSQTAVRLTSGDSEVISGIVEGVQSAAQWSIWRFNGSSTLPTHISAADLIGQFTWRAYGATAYQNGYTARITCNALQDFSDTAGGSQVAIWAAPLNVITPQQLATFGPGATFGVPYAAGVPDLGRGTLVLNQNANPPVNLAVTGNNLLCIGADGASSNPITLAIGANANWNCYRANGSAVALTAVVSGNSLGRLSTAGWDTSSWAPNAASIQFLAGENWSPANHGATMVITTTPNAGASQSSLTLDGPGNLTILGSTATKPGGGSWTAPSDRRLKREVAPYTGGLEELLRLEPISYRYNGRAGTPDDSARYVGLDAEEARKVLPDMVGAMQWRAPRVDEKGDLVVEGAPEEYLTVDPSLLVFALINAVKQLHDRIVNGP